MGEVIDMNKRMRLVFSTLQGIAAVIALIGTVMAVWLILFGWDVFCYFRTEQQTLVALYAVIGMLTVAVVSAFSYVALYQFFRLCGRLKNETAFTTVNEQAMRRIAVSCAVCGATLAAALIIAMFYGGFFLGFVQGMFLLSFAYLSVGLVAYAFELLLRRATAIQQENDLTI